MTQKRIFLNCIRHDYVANSVIPIKRDICHGASEKTGKKEKDPSWVNQDRHFVYKNDHASYFVVMDGHGPNGHHASQLCRDQLKKILQNHIEDDENELNFEEIYEKIQKDIENSDIDFECSGTTCTLLRITKGEITIVNVGDSGAMLGRRKQVDENLNSKVLSYDHSPDVEEEVQRITECGGQVAPQDLTVAEEVKIRRYNIEKANKKEDKRLQAPMRVWYQCGKNNEVKMGLGMTRSLGDTKAHLVGVICKPFIKTQPLEDNDELIIIASDGLWDVLNYEKTAYYVDEYISSLPPVQNKSEWDPQEAADILVTVARKKWEKSGMKSIDDITCCVVKLGYSIEVGLCCH